MTNRQRGAVSLEAALLLPVLLGLVVMFFEIGRLQLHFASIDHAVQQAKRDAQLQPVPDSNMLVQVFSERLALHQPRYAGAMEVEAQAYDSIDEWLHGFPADQQEDAQQASAQMSSPGVLQLDIRVSLTPLAIPLFGSDGEMYQYRRSTTLIAEKHFDSE